MLKIKKINKNWVGYKTCNQPKLLIDGDKFR